MPKDDADEEKRKGDILEGLNLVVRCLSGRVFVDDKLLVFMGRGSCMK